MPKCGIRRGIPQPCCTKDADVSDPNNDQKQKYTMPFTTEDRAKVGKYTEQNRVAMT